MPAVRSLRRCCALPVLATLAVAVACSSNSATGPTTSQNARLILRFDSLMHTATDGFRVSAYANFAAILAEGAPVGSGVITVNGAPERFKLIAELDVEDQNGVPADSQYTVAGWQGDGSDSLVLFNSSGGFIALLRSSVQQSVLSFGGTASVMPGTPGAACQSFLDVTPPDIEAPQPIRCQVQVAADSFAVIETTVQGDTITLPNQMLTGIRVEIEQAVPPP